MDGSAGTTRTDAASKVLGAPRLSSWQKVFYGAGDSTNSMSGTIVDLFLLYYFTDILGLRPILAGMVLLFGQIWDAFNDPVMGYLSDRSKSSFGRRRIFMAVSAVPLGLTYIFLWRLPPGLPEWSAFVLAVFVYILYDTFNTGFSVPYQAMGIEISKNYDERTSLVAWRMLFSIITGLVATVVPMMIVDAVPVVFSPGLLAAVENAVRGGALPEKVLDAIRGGITSANGAITPDLMSRIREAVSSGVLPADFVDSVNIAVTAAKRVGFPLMGLAFGLSFIAFPFFPIVAFRERNEPDRRHEPFLQSMSLIIRDATFRRMLGYYYLIWATIGIIMANMMYYFKYVLQMENEFEVIAGGMFIIAALALPLWVKVSSRYDKKTANIAGTLIFGGVLFLLLLPPDIIKATWFTLPFVDVPVSALWPIVVVVGIGLSAAHVLPNAIMPEAVDKCRLETGISSDGAYYGALNFCFKAGRAFALLAASVALQLTGYIKVTAEGLVPESQPASAILAIRLLMGLVSPILICSSVLLLRKYTIGRKEHQEILRKLYERGDLQMEEAEPEAATPRAAKAPRAVSGKRTLSGIRHAWRQKRAHRRGRPRRG
jgi:GPH family glycoside/pentoside/hexuronide:cation symporter